MTILELKHVYITLLLTIFYLQLIMILLIIKHESLN
jgi:hypothetical protein